MNKSRETLLKMNETIIKLLEQIEIFQNDEKKYEAYEAHKIFDRISYFISIQDKYEDLKAYKFPTNQSWMCKDYKNDYS